MKHIKPIDTKLFCIVSFAFLMAIVVGVLGLLLCQAVLPTGFGIPVTVLAVLVILALILFFASFFTRKFREQTTKLEKEKNWYRQILDAIDFPIHVTDNDMNWSFLNRAFEKLMIDQGVIKDRESGYGMACSNAGANICKTENCGISQLRRGVNQSYFSWCGMECKQDTSYLLDENGNRIGFVEVVTDLTSLIRVNEYNAAELKRIVENMRRLAAGNLELDFNVGEADQYTTESNRDFVEISHSIREVKDALSMMVSEADILANAAVEGDLTARADTTKHMGSYRKVIEGFNSTMNSIVAPMNEAINILNQIGKNELDSPMSSQYKGTYRILSDAINGLRERLLSIEDAFVKVSIGDTSRLEEFKRIGKRSEKDKLTPAATAMMQVLRDLIEEANRLAVSAVEGKLNVRGNAEKFEGGYSEIIQGMNQTMEAVEAPFTEISEVLSYMAKGDLTRTMDGEYSGEYLIIKNSVNTALKSVSNVLGNINIAAEQVSTGSSQVSDSSQALSQGATEQASSIEELSASISDIAAQTKSNSVRAVQANELAVLAKSDADIGNEQMKLMLNSMRDINEASANISKVIKVIEDIAFQTNILALNAAVEAARAGQYGKGFAVVADEVRNLAAKSADAARETTAMIEGSIKKVESGTKIAAETAEALVKIVNGIEKAAGLVAEIATASNEQATGITQVNQGIEQVSQVVQVNSATAEESAAASEELSSQADLLREMIHKFTLQDSRISENTNTFLSASKAAVRAPAASGIVTAPSKFD